MAAGLPLGGLPDLAAVTAEIEHGLRQAGLPAPLVTVRPVAALDRDPLTGKARRFIPLGAGLAKPSAASVGPAGPIEFRLDAASAIPAVLAGILAGRARP